jgi:hypothetical protein
MLVGSNHGTIYDHPFQIRVLEYLEHSFPDPLGGPSIEPLPDRAPRSEPLGEVTPGCPGLGDPENRIDEKAIVLGGHAGIARLAGEEILDAFPTIIWDFMAMHG